MSDDVRDLVDRAVFFIQQGPSKEVLESFAQLAELDPSTLLPELYLQVEEAASDVDMNRLRPTDLVPDVDFARKLVHAVVDQDIDLLRSVINGDYSDLLVGLVSVVAALKAVATAA